MRKKSLSRAFAKATLFMAPAVAMASPAQAGEAEFLDVDTLQETCFTLNSDADTPSPNVNSVLQEFERVAAYNTYLSSPMIRMIKGDNTKICMKQLEYGAGAAWSPITKEITLGYSSYDVTHQRLSYLFHEFAHASQDDAGLLRFNQSWSPLERQQRILLAEAAAKTVEYTTAYDLKLYGYSNVWNIISAGRMRHASVTLDAAYQSDFSEGQNHGRALAAGANAFWQQNITDQKWLDFYNLRVVRRYLYDYQRNKLSKDNGRRAPDLNDVRNSVRLADGTQLFSDLENMPQGTGTNDNLRYILNHLQVEHFAKRYGRNSQAYQSAYETYDQENNPYRNVDLNDVPRRANNLTVQFDCLAERYTCKFENGEYSRVYQYNRTINGQINSPINRYRHPHSIPR